MVSSVAPDQTLNFVVSNLLFELWFNDPLNISVMFQTVPREREKEKNGIDEKKASTLQLASSETSPAKSQLLQEQL